MNTFFKLLAEQLRPNRKWSLRNLNYLPRWIIFGIDIAIVIFSGILTINLLQDFQRFYININYFWSIVLLLISVHVIFFIYFKVYSGIVRHSTLTDGVRIFYAVFFSGTTLITINLLSTGFLELKFFSNHAIIINGALSFTFLLLFRIIVKKIFDQYVRKDDERNGIPAMIYGTDRNSIAIANVLLNETPRRFKIKGFIDRKGKATSKRVLDLPIITCDDCRHEAQTNGSFKALILADKSLTKIERNNLVDEFLEHNIQVYNAPVVSENSSENAKIAKNVRNIKIEDLLERDPIILDKSFIGEKIKGKTVLVTGGAGSIGSEIVRQVAAFSPKELLVLDQAESPLFQIGIELKEHFPHLHFKLLVADIRDYSKLELIFDQNEPHYVYHAAAYKHVPLMEDNPHQAVRTNICGTKNLADLSVQYGVQRFVMVSTDKAVNPSNVMGASKRVAEIYVQSLANSLSNTNSKTKFITTRFGNVLGSNGSVVPVFAKQIENGGPVTITHPDIIRYFMTIAEACQLVIEAGAIGKGGEIFLFDMGNPVRIKDLAVKMIKLAGYIPEEEIKIKVVGLRPGEKLYEELLTANTKTLPTHNDKIMICLADSPSYSDVLLAVNKIIRDSEGDDEFTTISSIKELVPEFKSLNSHFSVLDNR